MSSRYDENWFKSAENKIHGFIYVDLDAKQNDFDISQIKLSPAFVGIVTKGYENYASIFRAEVIQRVGNLDFEKMSERNIDVIHTITRRAKLVLSPFSGKWTTSYNIAGREAYWLLEDQKVCIVAQFSDALFSAFDSVFIFPESRHVLYFGKLMSLELVHAETENLFKCFTKNFQQAFRLFKNVSIYKKIGAVEMYAPHFGHYIWNALSAWDHLLPIHGKKVNFYITWLGNCFVGRVTDLFPECRGRGLYVIGCDLELFNIANDEHAILVFPKENYIKSALSRRIIAFAQKTCPSIGRSEISALRSQCGIVCLLGVRLGNRAWIEQETGYVALAAALRQKFGSIGFIIDGMSRDTHMGWTHKLMSLSEEISLAKTLESTIGAIAPCLNLVGRTMAESIIGVEESDFFVASAGSAMVKYKWISNLPGVVIANSTVLDINNPSGWGVRIFEQNMDRVRQSLFIDKSKVSDVSAPLRNHPAHDNFYLDWTDIYNIIVENIDCLIK